ncbi:ATP-dependent helicase [Desulfoprunum benzoelyticum]|uniref:DNA 3'-5' helicase n=1 Tax=Desulfoprunum benzoelyticum TaxID=1506996 RepID=A0A840UY51_9BACT|nr:ATP-dependent helicase [Desulfoprunum benzoelyticum]MBB5347588.1 DNA helicase-2/ATP-dependent DNA helicase PcrA [Desulfoprunum benzoelyticum]MBM9531094.1 ATP-dependent helicase [Desulfoprunum benzoelyticum]
MNNEGPFSGAGGVAAVDLSELNDAQYEAVTTVDGPVLVIAGAGSGKTRTLVYRVAYLMQHGIPPEKILLLTFTRKAAQEMLWRSGRLLNDSCGRVVGGTFHGTANMLLRRYGACLGFASNFTIIDRADAEGIINLLKSSLGFGGASKQFPSKRVLISMISGAVNKSMELEDLVFEQYAHLSEHLDDILRLQRHYGEFKRDNGLMDYDDLLVNWKRMLQESEEVRRLISERFSHIMVDEYQDTNLIQADIVRLAASTHDNVMAVGDDAQSIYSFRGADFYNIMRFPKVYPDTRIIKLEENYRSTQPILALTNDIIKNAAEKYTKTLFSRTEGGVRPALFAGRDEREEALFVVRRVRELLALGTPIQEIAVLFRSGFHSYKLELELGATGIDFEKRGGLKLTESAHMKDFLSFLRVVANPRDSLSWNRILLQLDKVGPKTAQKITATVMTAGDPFQALAGYPAGRSWQQGFARLNELFADLRGRERSLPELYEVVLAYYQPIFEQLFADDYPKRQKDLDQLKGVMAGYQDLQSFIDDTALDPPEPDQHGHRRAEERLVLSTIHSAKGLEFDAVFVIGLAEGRFPHAAAMIGEQWEEERRLLYVAATRARKFLYLCYPRELMTPDRQFRRAGMSPFLTELGPGLYERISAEAGSTGEWSGSTSIPDPAAPRLPAAPARRQPPAISEFAKGCKVSHPFFGEGKVTKLSGPRTLDVLFDRHGMKTLHLDYAKLTIL